MDRKKEKERGAAQTKKATATAAVTTLVEYIYSSQSAETARERASNGLTVGFGGGGKELF